jgi:hypothetical protein
LRLRLKDSWPIQLFRIHKEKEMADFRKYYVLAAVILLLGFAGTASAQGVGPFTCVANAAVPPTLRSEGMTELVGDIVLDCTGGSSTPSTTIIPRVNFTVFLNTNVTSRTYDSSGTSEALLLVDEPGSNNNLTSPILVCASTSGCDVQGTATTNPNGVTFPGAEPYNGGVGVAAAVGTTRANGYRGIVSGNQVQFIGVPVDAPGTVNHRVFRITNIRANASGISAGPSGTPGTIQALISASGSTSVPINNPTQVVGYVQSGLTFTLRSRSDISSTPNTTTNLQFPQCNSLSRTSTSGTNAFIAQFTENFPTAFKLRANGVTTYGGAPAQQSVPGVIYNTESGLYNTSGFASTTQVAAAAPTAGTLPTNVGLADTATRLKLVISNIPAGISVYASNGLLTASGTLAAGTSAVLLTGENGPVAAATATNTDFPCGSAMCSGSLSATQLPISNNSATAVYEVTGANPLSPDSYNVGVWFSFTGNASQNSPAPGSAVAVGGFAPTPSGLGVSNTVAATASSSLNIPRFIEGTQSRTILQIYVCRTNLLFPFVTNQAGFDTGLAIANTSTDPFGTTAQNGSCTLFSYGANAPASIPTGSIASGTVYVNLASTAMPNFQGYVIAQCAFQFAHGFAFVSDFGARNLAMGYLALIIPEPGLGSRGTGGQGSAGAGTGEGLVN